MISVRALSYNIRHCRGMDGRVSPDRVAEVIAASGADLVALQEVDVGRARTGGLDQAETIARRLGMDHHFHPALHLADERYGDAILTRLPSRLVRSGILPGLANRPGLEPRGALWVEVTANGRILQVFNTHLGLSAKERMAQAKALLGPDWTGSPDCVSPFVLMGDFNAIPQSAAYRRLAAHLVDARRIAGQKSGSATFPSRWPLLRIDHVFVGPEVRVRRMEVVHTPLARRASDHLPLLVELEIGPATV
ncbi:endonuclease/exonuclease/phosphatase family protein [Methylobacterium sp. WCS2018Hpa-22]|uniref:endonuclease/exonuclease/phosphatase family protein n=1 Tax=Methylobacterium sp. WCS2018Hpa-22 TaxID=3073633 RepID=UPI00288B94D6|nr:endonuclease/exonuclease/phosphatase family protein [Methylobacterium sp. WCS2018Hpa-22]